MDLLNEFPSIVLGILEKFEDRDYTLQLGIKDIDKIMKRLDRNFNRMSLSVVLLAVSIIITGVIIGSSQSASPGSEMYFVNVTALRIGLGIVVAIIWAWLFHVSVKSLLIMFFLLNSVLHLGQVMTIVPLPLGTRSWALHVGQEKYLWVFASLIRIIILSVVFLNHAVKESINITNL